jgi:hypothetical protein
VLAPRGLWQPCAVLLLVALLLAPPAVASPSPAPIAPASDDRSQIEADLDAVLNERGKAYLEARARLEGSRVAGGPADRRPPAPRAGADAAEERRLLALLAAMARPEDLEMFAAQMRREVAASHQRHPGARRAARRGAVAGDPPRARARPRCRP